MRWVVLLFLFAAPLQAQERQSLKEFPSVTGVSRVTLVGYTLIFDLASLPPPPLARQWWAEMERCTGLRGDFDSIGWYQADWMVNPLEREAYRGIYFTDLVEIVIQRGLPTEQFEDTVKHEILHHLVNVPGHDEAAFLQCLPSGEEH